MVDESPTAGLLPTHQIPPASYLPLGARYIFQCTLAQGVYPSNVIMVFS